MNRTIPACATEPDHECRALYGTMIAAPISLGLWTGIVVAVMHIL